MAHNNRSGPRHRSASRPKKEQINVSITQVVQQINSTVDGKADLRGLRNCLFPKVDPESHIKLHALWKLVKDNPGNFILVEPQKEPDSVTGNEIIWVRTNLGLCKTHCRKGKDGRNRVCDGECGELHVCRTFLLRSQNDCPFSSKKRGCMFGHSFYTEHNVAQLKMNNLFGLNEPDLRKLFRRRPSRCASTLPQVCIYYNRADGKQCQQKNCKSLHLCSDFIQDRCLGACSRNHKLSTPQVQKVFEYFAIDNSWTPENLLKDLQHFMTARHRTASENNSSSEETASSDSDSEDGMAERFREMDLSNHRGPAALSHQGGDFSDKQSGTCAGCEELKKDLKKVQLSVSLLTSQVKDLTKIAEEVNTMKAELEELRLANRSRPRSLNQQADDESRARSLQPSSKTSAINGASKDKINVAMSEISPPWPNHEDARFTRIQLDSFFTGLQPESTHLGSKKRHNFDSSSERN